MSTLVGLVGCSSGKKNWAAPAREMYRSPLFRLSAAYVEAHCDRWYVLSSYYGLLHPDTEIGPYDRRLRAGTELDDWVEKVREQLRTELAEVRAPALVVLAGERYRTFLHPCQWPFSIPMQGLGIGHQLAWLSSELRSAPTAS